MSDENKSREKTFEFPMMPIYGLDLGRDLGSIDARLDQLESDNREIKRDVKAVDAKIDAVDSRVDKCLVAINRLDERTKTDHTLLIGLWVTVIAGIVLQYFPK